MATYILCLQLREIGLEYYNCDLNPWVSSLASHLASERAGKILRSYFENITCSKSKNNLTV
jgi:hypothetical protein